MRKENLALLALFLLTVMAFSLVPVNAFIYPDGSVDGQYEDFGPRLDRIQVIMYPNSNAMWIGLRNGEIDVIDWPLTLPWLTAFTTPPANATVQVTSYGGEAGMYLVDFNLNNNPLLGNPPGYPPGYPNPVVDPAANIQNPASNLHFRRGVNYLFDRAWYQGIIAGWGIMIYTPIPSYMGSPNPGEGPINQEIRPGGALEALTYPFNVADAEAEFALAKMKIVAGQNGNQRFWDRNDNNICDAGEDIVINFNSRQDAGRSNAAVWIDAQLTALGFKMDTDYLTGGQDYQETMLDKNYHMATPGWINLGPDPDFLYNLYHTNSYWHDPESACPNTQCLNDTITNHWAESIKFNTTYEGARLSAWKFQERFATVAAQIPLFSNDGYKAHSRTYVGGTPEEAAYVGNSWEGLCNKMGFGDNSWYTFENAHPQGFDYGDGSHMTVRYGWSETDYPQHINPLYSESYWDTEVLSKVYDTLGHRNPYTLSTWQPYLIENWTVGTWMDGEVEKSKVTVTLRPDVYFADGVQVTVDDVIYSLTEVAHRLVDLGYPPPWSWPTTMQVQGAKILDPYNIEILFGVKSYLAISWALGGFYIIPKHVWKPIVETGDPTQFAADPNVVGSGPWRYVSMTTGVSLLMVANKPGSVVTTDRPGSSATTSPGVFNYYPVDIQAYETSYLAKFLPDSDLTFKVKLSNMWTGTPVTVDKYVSIKRVNPAGNLSPTLASIAISTLGIVLAPNVPHEELFPVDNAYAGKIQINVTIVYQTAPFIGLKRTVIVDPWITIKQDIAGSIMGTPGFPIPDFRVDGKDSWAVSHAYDTSPGHPRWNPIADVDGDYDVDMNDVYLIQIAFGWMAGMPTPPQSIPPQNIAVTDVQVSKTLVCQGYSLRINATVQNQGTLQQNIELSVAFGSNSVSIPSFSLAGGATTTVTVFAIPRSFLFSVAWRRSATGSYPYTVGDISLTGTGTSLQTSTQTMIVGGQPMSGKNITLRDLSSNIVMQRWVPVYGFTKGVYDQGLYIIGTDSGELFFATDSGDFGELRLGQLPVKYIAVNEANITVVMGNEEILLIRQLMDFNIPKGNHAISVTAKGIFADPDPNDNTFSDGTVQVTMTGDITADGKVDGRDIAKIAKAFGKLAGQEGFVPNVDINSDDKIDGKDIAIASKYFGTVDP